MRLHALLLVLTTALLCESEASAAEFIRGDVNDDSAVDISDAQFLLGHLFQGGGDPSCLDTADANDDGSVDISDAIHVLQYLFLGTDSPAPPFQAAGYDPTPTDAYTCGDDPCGVNGCVVDDDGDGFGVDEDCDDANKNVHPGAVEVCNDLDDDCDGFVDNVAVPDAGTTTRFVVIGDYGNGSSSSQDVADMVHTWNPEFIVTAGDNNYPDGEAATIDHHIGQLYYDFIGGYSGSYGQAPPTNRFFPSLGNHDWYSGSGADPYLNFFELPGNERYYDVVKGSVHLFIIDSDSREPDGNTVGSVQAQWLENGLAASTSPFQVVVFHHPPFSGATHGSSTWMRWPFRAWGADLVISGHEHTYERLESGDLTYIVNGSGGVSLRSFNNWTSESRVQYSDLHGAQWVEADDNHMTFDFIDLQDNLVDSYTLWAGADRSAPSTSLLDTGASWRYLDTGTDPAIDWTEPGFNDSSWDQGPSPLGYGNGGEATVVRYGGSSSNKHLTTWFRTEFNVDSDCDWEQLLLRLVRDDGVLVYLNGEEVYRTNMPRGAVDGQTRAASTIGSGGESAFLETWLDPNLLQVGENQLAVEVHQVSPTSSDLAFDLQLLGF